MIGIIKKKEREREKIRNKKRLWKEKRRKRGKDELNEERHVPVTRIHI